MRLMGIILRRLGLGLMVLLLAGATYQQIGVVLDAKLTPSSSEMVSVNGRAVHLLCQGAGHRTFVGPLAPAFSHTTRHTRLLGHRLMWAFKC